MVKTLGHSADPCCLKGHIYSFIGQLWKKPAIKYNIYDIKYWNVCSGYAHVPFLIFNNSYGLLLWIKY